MPRKTYWGVGVSCTLAQDRGERSVSSFSWFTPRTHLTAGGRFQIWFGMRGGELTSTLQYSCYTHLAAQLNNMSRILFWSLLLLCRLSPLFHIVLCNSGYDGGGGKEGGSVVYNETPHLGLRDFQPIFWKLDVSTFSWVEGQTPIHSP
jgi:hypothetical protein